MSLRIRRTGTLLLACLGIALLLLGSTGCTSSTSEEPSEATSATDVTSTIEPAPTPEPETIDLRVYLVRGEELGVGSREITKTPAVARAALEQLLVGPTSEEAEAGLATMIPEGTTLLGVSIEDGIATVDLSQQFESGGGSLSMFMRIGQVVYTLTQFDTVDSVAFMIEGAEVEYIGGEGIIVAPSVSRSDFADAVCPAILVESPTPWQNVASPLRVTGESNTFEATFQYEIVDPRGLIVYSDFVTAHGGMGTWGPFDLTIDYEIAYDGIGALIVYEISAKDGSHINLVEIPLRMAGNP